MIEPGVGIPPFTLGMSTAALEGVIDVTPPRAQAIGLANLRAGSLELRVENGCVVQIVATSSDGGATPAGIQVGDSYLKLNGTASEMAYDEEQELWFDVATPGLGYALTRPVRTDESPIDPAGVPELYSINDPEHAWVAAIYVCPLDGAARLKRWQPISDEPG